MSATNRGAVRLYNDAYYTPTSAIVPFLRILDTVNPRTILEPCAGPGSVLWKALAENWPHASLTCYDTALGTDFLKLEDTNTYDLCITNPPYKHAQAFVDKALGCCRSTAFLLRLNFLGSQRRRDWWQRTMPDSLVVLSRRPSFTGRGTDATEYAWFCWGAAFIRIPPLVIL